MLIDAPRDQRLPWPVHPAAELFRLLVDDELQELAEDIRAHGLHEPVWLYDDPYTSQRMLLDGRNRARACALIGVEPLTRIYTGDDPIGFSISQNVKRRHLDAWDRAAGAAKAEELYAAEAKRRQGSPGVAKPHGESISVEEIFPQPAERAPQARDLAAKAFGVSGRNVSAYKRVAQDSELVSQREQQPADKRLTLGRAERLIRDREAAERRRDRAEQTIAAGKGRYDLRSGDFRDVLADIPDGSVDLILTDPPYGDAATPIYGSLAKFADRVLVDGGSLVCYSGQSVLPDVFNQMTPHLRYWWTLALEHTHGGQQFPGKWVMVEWKPILWFVKEHRRGRGYVADRVRGTRPDKDTHEWAQGIEEVKYLIEQLTDPGNLVVDPFAGSGSFGVAAVHLGRHFIGADLNPGSRIGQVVA